MATSFESKLNEIEARLKARNGVSGVEHIPAASTNSPAPRRPKPCLFLCFKDLTSDNSHVYCKLNFAGCRYSWNGSSVDKKAQATVPSSRSRWGYGAVNTVSFSVSVKLVLTPTLTLNDPLTQNFTTKRHGHFKCTDTANGNGYTNYHR